MKKIILLSLLLVTATTNAYAGITSEAAASAGFSKLTEAQKAEVLKTIAQQAESNTSFNPGVNQALNDPESVERWTKLGTSIASGIGAAAKELNIGVNEFAQTPVGKVTTALIVWKLMGAQLIHVIGGILVWIVGFGCIRMFCKTIQSQDIQYSTTDKNIFGNYVIIKNKLSRLSEGEQIGVFLMNILVFVIGIVTLFSY